MVRENGEEVEGEGRGSGGRKGGGRRQKRGREKRGKGEGEWRKTPSVPVSYMSIEGYYTVRASVSLAVASESLVLRFQSCIWLFLSNRCVNSGVCSFTCTFTRGDPCGRVMVFNAVNRSSSLPCVFESSLGHILETSQVLLAGGQVVFLGDLLFKPNFAIDSAKMSEIYNLDGL